MLLCTVICRSRTTYKKITYKTISEGSFSCMGFATYLIQSGGGTSHSNGCTTSLRTPGLDIIYYLPDKNYFVKVINDTGINADLKLEASHHPLTICATLLSFLLVDRTCSHVYNHLLQFKQINFLLFVCFIHMTAPHNFIQKRA